MSSFNGTPTPSAPMRVCMYTPASFGGHARYTHELMTALARAAATHGATVELVTSADLQEEFRRGGYPIHDVLPPFGTPVTGRHRWFRWAISRAAVARRRSRVLRKWFAKAAGVTHIHFQAYAPWRAGRDFQRFRRCGLRLVYTVHNVRPHKYPMGIPRWLFDYWNRRGWSLCDGLIVHTEGLRKELAGFLGESAPSIFVVPHGVWTSASEENRIMQRPEGRSRNRLLFFGAIRANKGLDVLLRALEWLPDVTLTVAGRPEDAQYWQRVKAQLAEARPAQVEILDQFVEADELGSLFARSDALVLPYTEFAAQSGVLCDALAHGLPVVASDTGGLGESVRTWGIGEVVPPGDPAALADGIRRLLAPRRYWTAVAAVYRSSEELSWERSAQLTLEVYRAVW